AARRHRRVRDLRLGSAGAARRHADGRRAARAQAGQGAGADPRGSDRTDRRAAAVRVAQSARPRAHARPAAVGTRPASMIWPLRWAVRFAAGLLAILVTYLVVTFSQFSAACRDDHADTSQVILVCGAATDYGTT